MSSPMSFYPGPDGEGIHQTWEEKQSQNQSGTASVNEIW